MADSVGWRNFWWLNVALHTLVFLAVLVGFPETMWDRVHRIEPEKRNQLNAVASNEKALTNNNQPPLDKPSVRAIASHAGTFVSLMPTTQGDIFLGKGKPNRLQWKLLQRATHPFRSLAYNFFLPWKIFIFPIIQFASFATSFSCTCYLMINLIQSQALAGNPYRFKSQAIGFTNFAPLVGAFIGLFTCGPSSDWVSAKLTKRNNGVREPEMRLPVMVPYVLIMILGNFIVGFGFQYHWDWRVSLLLVSNVNRLAD